MTLLLKQLIGLIKLLHSENGSQQIAWGFTLGVILGFSPFFSLQTFLVLFLLLIFKIQIAAAFLSAFVFKFIAYLIDPLAHSLGAITLENESLRPVWTQLYNMPIIPYTRFNNSIVMGSFILGLIISPLMYFIFIKVIKKYRETVVAKTENSKLWKAFTSSKFYVWYTKYQDLYDVK